MAKKYFKKEHEAIFNIITYHLTEDRMARLFEAVQGYKNYCANALTDEMIDAHAYGMSIKIDKNSDKAQANAWAQGMKDCKEIILNR